MFNTQRLNAFGFLNSQDLQDRAQSRKDVAVNLGYLDQRLALEWIQNNIAYFGGDPKKVHSLWPILGGVVDTLTRLCRSLCSAKALERLLLGLICLLKTMSPGSCFVQQLCNREQLPGASYPRGLFQDVTFQCFLIAIYRW